MKKIFVGIALCFITIILFAQNNNNKTSIQEVFDCKTVSNLKIKYGASNVIYDTKNSNYNKVFVYPDTKNQLNIYLKNGIINNIEIAFTNGKWYNPKNSDYTAISSNNTTPNVIEVIDCNMYVAYINSVNNAQYLIMPITPKNKLYYGLGFKVWNTSKGFYILPTQTELKTAGPYKSFKLAINACLSFQHNAFLVLDEFTPANATYYNRYMNNYKFKIGEPIKDLNGQLWSYACGAEVQLQKSEYSYQNSKNVNPDEFKRADQSAILDAATKDLAKYGSASNVPNKFSTYETIDSASVTDKEDENTEVKVRPTTKFVEMIENEDKVETENDTIYEKADISPSFPGGVVELIKYLQKNTHYPSLARENGLSGTVIVKFYIDIDGSIKEPVVIKDGVGGGCSNEAILVIKSMPKWTPGSINGRTVKVYSTVPVSFKIQ